MSFYMSKSQKYLFFVQEIYRGAVKMRVVLQRSKAASVKVANEITGAITEGLVLLVGFGHEDTEAVVEKVANKIVGLRIFSDDAGKMNLSLDKDTQAILAISQFTLYGNVKKGRRPSFTESMDPVEAERLYQYFCTYIRGLGFTVAAGIFGADMDVALVNDGPVTLMIDSSTL